MLLAPDQPFFHCSDLVAKMAALYTAALAAQLPGVLEEPYRQMSLKNIVLGSCVPFLRGFSCLPWYHNVTCVDSAIPMHCLQPPIVHLEVRLMWHPPLSGLVGLRIHTQLV